MEHDNERVPEEELVAVVLDLIGHSHRGLPVWRGRWLLKVVMPFDQDPAPESYL